MEPIKWDAEFIQNYQIAFLEDLVNYYGEDNSRRAVEENTVERAICRYRTRDGRKCAIGRYIPDDKYDPRIEGKSTCSSEVMSLLSSDIQKMTKSFLATCQNLHDENSYWNILRGKGLTESGKAEYERIKQEIRSGYYSKQVL